MKILIHWLISALAIVISAYVLPGVSVSGFKAALILALVLGIINGLIRPVLVLLTLPLTILTFGLFLFILNTLLIMLAATIVTGFTLDSFWWALIFGVVLTLVNSILDSVLSKE